jgi:hypothetical protein
MVKLSVRVTLLVLSAEYPVNARLIVAPPVSVTTTLPYWETTEVPDAGYGPADQDPAALILELLMNGAASRR